MIRDSCRISMHCCGAVTDFERSVLMSDLDTEVVSWPRFDCPVFDDAYTSFHMHVVQYNASLCYVDPDLQHVHTRIAYNRRRSAICNKKVTKPKQEVRCKWSKSPRDAIDYIMAV